MSSSPEQIAVERTASNNTDEEKRNVSGVVLHANEEYEPSLHDGVLRKMEQRHLQMFALAGTIGTGLFLGSGKVLRYGGPLLALLDYMLMGSVCWGMIQSLGEMSVFAPISGGYIHHAERWLHPSVGFALGWQNVFHGIFSTPSELVSASVLCSYWDTDFPSSHQAAYVAAFLVGMTLLNFFGVRWWGESEFIFACLKIALIVGLIIGGLVIDLGGGPNGVRLGFTYWQNPGAINTYHSTGSLGRFLAWFKDLRQAAYAFTSVEQLAVAAAEVKNPRSSVAKAARRVFYRIIIFYVLGILIIGMLVPYNDPGLLKDTGTSASSPFVIAFSRAGVTVLPSIINAIIISSAFSASNSGLYAHSRMLYGLAIRRQAPKIFARSNSRGVPYVALGTNVLSLGLGYLGIASGSATALTWLTNLTTLSALITWLVICATYLRFKAGLAAQGVDRRSLHFANMLQPFPAIWAGFWCAIILVFNGWELFTVGNWDVGTFFVDYVNIPIFFLFLVIWQVWKRPKWVKAEDLDFVTDIPTDEELYYEEIPPKTWYGKVLAFLFT